MEREVGQFLVCRIPTGLRLVPLGDSPSHPNWSALLSDVARSLANGAGVAPGEAFGSQPTRLAMFEWFLSSGRDWLGRVKPVYTLRGSDWSRSARSRRRIASVITSASRLNSFAFIDN